MSYAQKILFFFCRPCGTYHEKTRSRHFAEQWARVEEQREAAKPKHERKKKGETNRPP